MLSTPSTRLFARDGRRCRPAHERITRARSRPSRSPRTTTSSAGTTRGFGCGHDWTQGDVGSGTPQRDTGLPAQRSFGGSSITRSREVATPPPTGAVSIESTQHLTGRESLHAVVVFVRDRLAQGKGPLLAGAEGAVRSGKDGDVERLVGFEAAEH